MVKSSTQLSFDFILRFSWSGLQNTIQITTTKINVNLISSVDHRLSLIIL